MLGSTKGGGFFSIPETREEAILLVRSAGKNSLGEMNDAGWEAAFAFGVFCCEACKTEWLAEGGKTPPGVEMMVLDSDRRGRRSEEEGGE